MEDREKEDLLFLFCERNVFYTLKGQSSCLYRVLAPSGMLSANSFLSSHLATEATLMRASETVRVRPGRQAGESGTSPNLDSQAKAMFPLPSPSPSLFSLLTTPSLLMDRLGHTEHCCMGSNAIRSLPSRMIYLSHTLCSVCRQ